MKNIVKVVACLFLGALIGAYAFHNVLLPNHLIAGGLGGIATVIIMWYEMNVQIVLALLCLPILIWAYITFGIRQIIYAFTCFAFFTILLGVVALLPPLEIDVILAVLVSGVLFGVSGGLVLRLGIANGPEALIGLHLKNKYGISIGLFFTILNIIVVSSSLLNPEVTLNNIIYSMVSIYISGKVTDFIVAAFEGITK